MKGIIKGCLFSVLLSISAVSIFAFIRLFFEINSVLTRFIIWGLFCLNIFSGALFVSKAADSKKAVKGITSSLLSSLVLTLTLILSGKCNMSGSVCTIILLCMISGTIGSFAGSR